MKKIIGIVVIVFILLGLGGFFGFRMLSNSLKSQPATIADDGVIVDESLPENTSIVVSAKKSPTKDNTVVLEVGSLEKKYAGISYEVTYETKGTFQGVNSGTKPLDLSGQSVFTKEVYLGTCSKNVCTPHPGVTAVSIALELVDTSGKKSQFSKDFSV